MSEPVQIPPLDRLERLFRAARMHPPAERAAFLNAACADDPDLRAELDALLAADAEADANAFLDAPALPPEILLAAPAEDPLIGQEIGPYTVLRPLGEGGMGAVYLALRQAPFKRYVALKVLRDGLGGAEARQRFEVERQILASLDHPNLARLLDGGVTEDGRPYFAMEVVEGVPITRYCDERRLGLEARLRLFQAVCAAVHVAHQNLVLHRDLKPSNILVTAAGQVKLLDFGIAKLLNPALSPANPVVTRTELRVLTPEYASPEQVRGEPLSTASDVYSLGVLLYELLTGGRPHQLSGRSTHEIIEVLSHEEPQRPSTRARWAEDSETPAARGLSPERLRRRLRGDLDAICLKALRKEPDRRYRSVDELARDVERHLERRPVEARRGSRRYRLGRFLRRHRIEAAAAALVALALVGGAVAALWQAAEARQERDRTALALARAEETVGFLIALFEASDPIEARGAEVTARDLLARGEQRIEQLGGQPEVQAQLLRAIGLVYQHLGQYERAQRHLERALTLRRATIGPASPDAAESLADLGRLLRLRGEYEAAEAHLREALALQRATLGEQHPAVPQSLGALALVLRQRGEFDEAVATLQEALALQRAHLGADHPDAIRTLVLLGPMLRDVDRDDEAEAALQEALERQRRVLGEDHPSVAETYVHLGSMRARRGAYGEAEAYLRDALALQQRLYGPEHPEVARALGLVASAVTAQGRLDEAETLHREALGLKRRLLGPDHADVAASLNSLALLYEQRGDDAGAEALYREALATYRRALGPAHPHVATTMRNLGRMVERRGALAEAEALYREALTVRQQALGPDHSYVSGSLLDVARMAQARGDLAEAETLYRELLGRFRDRLGDDHERVQSALRGLAEVASAQGRVEEAAAYRALLAQ